LPPPIEDPNVTTRFGSAPGQRRANAIACAQVLELSRRFEQVRRAGAVAESTVVEDQREAAVLRKASGERPQAVPTRSRESVCHHDDRTGMLRLASGGLVHPRGARIAADVESRIGSVHAPSTSALTAT
jgi:hypothetical protein